MQIKYKNVTLRDMRESDIDDEIRWSTMETQWSLWDAPWEMEEELANFDPEAHRKKELEWLSKPRPDHRLSLEIETADGVHIGSVSSYCIDDELEWQGQIPGDADRKTLRWAVGIDIEDSAYWSGGWGTQALTAYLLYHLSEGYTRLYTQTWSGNLRMVGLAEKLGFRECRRKVGFRQVRGELYDSMTFQLDRDTFEAYLASVGGELQVLRSPALELYIPQEKDMWFARQMYEDRDTMAYNAGWPISYSGYHPDTGCIDFPENRWADKIKRFTADGADSFYAFVRETETGTFVGEVNFQHTASKKWHDMGVVLYAPFRGKGYGGPVLELLLRQAFLKRGVERLHNSFEAERDSALAIHRRAGFRQVGTSQWTRFGEPVTLLELELTREEYLAQRRKDNALS